VKKVPGAQGFKIIHDRYKRGKDAEVQAAKLEFLAGFDAAGRFTQEVGMKTHFARAMEDLNPVRVRQLFCAIPDEDLDLLWLDRERGRCVRSIGCSREFTESGARVAN
jgi:DNA-directed RNA polymerase III subunit RPC1